MKRFIAILLIGLYCSVAIAANTQDPMTMLQSVSDQMIAALKKERPNLKKNPNLVYQLTNKILVPHADVAGMSRSVLGREAWQSATPAEQKAFTQAFKDVVIRTYSGALSAYTDQTIKFYPLRGGYTGKRTIEINSQIIRQDGPPVPVNYRLAFLNGEWKVYDLNVEGVSLLQSFRSQLSSELSQGKTVAQITEDLQQRHQQKKST